jgi:tetratricopeptide (TPR) repeat protein
MQDFANCCTACAEVIKEKVTGSKKNFLICEMNLLENLFLKQIFKSTNGFVEDRKNIKGMVMNFASVFTLPEFKSISQNVIAILLYDISAEDFKNIDCQAVENIFFESINEAAVNILKSNRTKRRILKNLQSENLETELTGFRENGEALDEDYFEKRFAKVISTSNSKKIVPVFLDSFRERIVKNKVLLKQIGSNYLSRIQNGQWKVPAEQLETHPKETADEKLEEKRVEREKDTTEKAAEPEARKDFEIMHVNSPESGQVTHWNPDRHVLPVRGLRKIESSLAEDSLMYITGAPGCGKSLLVSVYLHNQVFNKTLKGENVYYYRFVEGVPEHHSFLLSLTAFLESQNLGVNVEDIARKLPLYLLRSASFYVFDDLHQVKNSALLELILQIWKAVETSTTFRGKLIVVDCERKSSFSSSKHYHYQGLSVAESNALLRDKWRLNLPKFLAFQMAKKFSGNTQLMMMFKNWWAIESHTDTELERFVEQMPDVEASEKNINVVRDYVAQRLYKTFEQVDSRLNSFLKSASIFRMPEQELFLERVYEKIGGGYFQVELEGLVEKYELIEYDDNLDRYKFHELIREFYYPAIHSIQLKRILHNTAGKLYRNRYHSYQRTIDAVEGAYHFRMAEREEEAVKLLEAVMALENLSEYEITQMLGILEDVNFDLLDNDQTKMHVLYSRGKFFLEIERLEQAEEDFAACERLQPPDYLKAPIIYSLGLIARKKEKIEQAFELFREALKIYESVDNKKGIIDTHRELNELYLLRGQSDLAFYIMEKTLTICKEIDNLPGALYAYSHLGNICKEREDWDNAFEYYQKSLEIYEKLHDYGGIAETLRNLGEIQEVRGELDEALEIYTREIKINEKLGNWMGMARVYKRVGDIYRQSGDLEKAMQYYRDAQEIFENGEDLSGLASVYNSIGSIHFHREEWESAMGLYQKSQEIYEKTDNQDDYGATFSQMAAVYKAMREWERALDMYDKALEVKEKLGDTRGIAESYDNIAGIYFARGEANYAMEVYERSIYMREALGDETGISQIYYKMANIHQKERQWQKAIQIYQRSLQLFRKTNNRPGSAMVYLALGSVYRELKDWSRSLDFCRRAIEVYQEVNDTKGLAIAYYETGIIYHDTSEWNLALEHYGKSLPLFEKTKDFSSMAQALGNISSIEFEKKDHIPAIGKQVEILLYFKERNQREMVERVLANLMSCHQELGPNTFQALLNNCIEDISKNGVQWGALEVIAAKKAAKLINSVFYTS